MLGIWFPNLHISFVYFFFLLSLDEKQSVTLSLYLKQEKLKMRYSLYFYYYFFYFSFDISSFRLVKVFQSLPKGNFFFPLKVTIHLSSMHPVRIDAKSYLCKKQNNRSSKTALLRKKKEKKWKKARIYVRNECTKDVLWQKWICPLFPLLKSLYEKITRLYVPRILLKIYETRARSAFFTRSRLPPGDI